MFKKGVKYKTKHTCVVPKVSFIAEKDCEYVTLYWYSDIGESHYKPYIIRKSDCDEII